MNTTSSGSPRVLLVVFTGHLDSLECRDTIVDDLGYSLDIRRPEAIDPAEGPYDLIIQLGIGPEEEHEKEKGLALLRGLRRLFDHTPILVLSLWEPRDILEEVLHSGATRYLQRLHLKSELIGTIQELVKHKAASP